jgi:hypothetical protein
VPGGKILSVPNWTIARQLDADHPIDLVAISRDGNVAAGSDALFPGVTVWSATTGAVVTDKLKWTKIGLRPGTDLQLSADGRLLAACQESSSSCGPWRRVNGQTR